jgi:hypothetical protein
VSAAPDLSLLRARLADRFGDAIRPAPGGAPPPPESGFPTRVAALDALMPGGLPRRALTLWTGEGTAGRTAALRVLVEEACRSALVGLVDATGTLDAAAWCTAGGRSPAGLWMARPPPGEHAARGPWVAESLLRTGIFGLVVLDGALPTPVQAHRLRALARDTGAALLVSVGAGDVPWRPDLRLEFRRVARQGGGLETGGRFRRPAEVNGCRGPSGRRGPGEVELVHAPEDRLHPDPVPDRRPRART